ncbi:hypothetical protein JCM19275_3620 [Nonlabens ulvanivorans]|uniref:Uncharacterized protein n=1 Tax=Nonlabens ulvanivorans TaxID=906888 RepID=A0A090WCM4_NONUL|nr:hypothetical protein JCM19275_3620 [Nonlabens ulvanivorans]
MCNINFYKSSIKNCLQLRRQFFINEYSFTRFRESVNKTFT